jgi:hypothetical protein
MNNLTAQDIRHHRSTLAKNSERWLKIDFELISDSLSIEINAEMPPLIIKKVIQAKVTEMSQQEYELVPKMVWDYLEGIEVLSEIPLTPVISDRSVLSPFRLRKMSKDSISLSPVGTTMGNFVENLTANPSWRSMVGALSMDVTLEADQVVVRSNRLYPWSERQLNQIFKSLDHKEPLVDLVYLN